MLYTIPGNVGQLAVYLLVSSTSAERIGYLDDTCILPRVGNDAYCPSPCGQLALPLEGEVLKSCNLFKLGKMIEFAKKLPEFASAAGKNGLQIYYLSSTNTNGTDDHCEKLGWKQLQEYNPMQRTWKYLSNSAVGNSMLDNGFPFEDDLEQEDYYLSLPFAALFSCFKAKGLKVTCLLCYCSEGDSMADAFHLALAARKLLGLIQKNFMVTRVVNCSSHSHGRLCMDHPQICPSFSLD